MMIPILRDVKILTVVQDYQIWDWSRCIRLAGSPSRILKLL